MSALFSMSWKSGSIYRTARGAEALDRVPFGSTAYRVVQLGPCPVHAVRA
jgi:hypothetical protein